MDFQLLGPVEATRDGHRVALTGTKTHTLLAALLLARGQVVPDARLSRLLWGADPPATMSGQIYTYVSRLRKLLGPEVTLERRAPGYALGTGDGRVDVLEYERLDRLGRQALQEHRHAEAATLLRDALGLWRGPVLVNVTEFLAEEEVPHWEEERATTLENRMEAELALGRHEGVVAELTRLVADFPLRERMRAQLMTALYRCGRQAEALQVFDEGRAVLAEELGVDPGHGLRAAHQALLCATLDLAPPPPAGHPPAHPSPPPAGRTPVSPSPPPAGQTSVSPSLPPAGQTPVTSSPPPVPGGAPVRPPRPRGTAPAPGPAARTQAMTPSMTPSVTPFMTPPEAPCFTGRARERAALARLLDARPGDAAGPRRCLITGMAGVGKTALAVHALHAARERFPDGQLYADLTGSHGTPEDPREVLARFLRALGAEPPGPVAGDLDELVRIYRTRTAERRLLVLLDNASERAAIAPLLPAGPHCAVLVTGHVHLAAETGPTVLPLAPLHRAESLALLTATAGRARTTAEPAAAERIVELCAGLPLALRIAGTRLVARPHWSVARLAQRLAAEPTRLGELSFGRLDVAGALARMLRRADTESREVLTRLTALGPRPFTPDSAAAALGLTASRAEDLVERLADACLLEPLPAGPAAVGGPAGSGSAFRFHPLLLLHLQSLPIQRPARAPLPGMAPVPPVSDAYKTWSP
ncbi:BTAD domain-containing putative transcriptional regulator [Streptomyces sp. NPDC007325]|uniref:AfsR/SARP family transcriptional regulator n=1 Tax=Streptomyces sp. NPDC007325 TaxID=3154588 RepID=UPI00340930C0